MTNDCKVSVIIPAYDVEEYIGKCIESVINQTYYNLEIIIIDDYSSDNTGRICDSYANDSRVIVIHHNNNKGLVSSRKDGLKIATGSYISFIDGDDYVDDVFIESLVKQIENTDADFIHGGFQQVDECNNYIESIVADFSPNNTFVFNSTADRVSFVNRHVMNTDQKCAMTYSIWSKLYKADIIKKSYLSVPNEQNYGEDLVSLLICILISKVIIVSKDTYYFYRIRKKSMSHIEKEEFLIKELGLYENILRIHELRTNVKYYNGVVVGVRNLLSYVIKQSARYRWTNIDEIEGKRVVIFGAGNVGRDYLYQLKNENVCDVIGIIDNDNAIKSIDGIEVHQIQYLLSCEYERILVAVKSKDTAVEIIDELKEFGLSENIILWVMPKKY